MVFWMPLLLKALSSQYSNTGVGILVMIPYLRTCSYARGCSQFGSHAGTPLPRRLSSVKTSFGSAQKGPYKLQIPAPTKHHRTTRKPARCQARTVSGLTMASAEHQSRQRRERQIHKRRSPEVNFKCFAADLC